MAITKSTIVARRVNVIASKRDNCDRIDLLAEFRKHELAHDEPQHRDEHCLIAAGYYPLRHRHDVTAITNSSQGNVQARLERDDFSLRHHPALSFRFARDLFRKPVPTFRDHALRSDARGGDGTDGCAPSAETFA
jgi:hypothetical protein